MSDAPVVRSLLETDLYKFTMWQALLHRQPAAEAEYEFRCRNKPAYPLAALEATLEEHAAGREVPVVQMMAMPLAVIAARAHALADRLAASGLHADIVDGVSTTGGGRT